MTSKATNCEGLEERSRDEGQAPCRGVYPLTPPSTRATPSRQKQKPHPPSTSPGIRPSLPSTPASTIASRGQSASLRDKGDSPEYLAKLLRLAKATPDQYPRNTDMDFLASFNFGTETAAPSTSSACASVEELQQRLQNVLSSKVSESRAEHVTISLELSASVLFSLQLSESEHQALEGLSNLDPSLGGFRSTSRAVPQGNGLYLQNVNASDTLTNQPQDNPILQKSVAKHIMDAIGATDHSSWTVREMSRTAQGWNFVYVCRDSYQLWKRQHAKSSKSSVIGEYSFKEPDPELMNRPAFDCRGSITVAFSRSSRSISINYDHTPIHRTVGQLAQLYKPPSRQLGPGAQKVKTPKKPASERKKGTPRSRDPNGSSRKRKRKNNGEAQAVSHDVDAPSEGLSILQAQMDGAASQEQSVQSTAQLNQESQSIGQPTQTPSQPPSMGLGLNLSTAEANRRRDVAMALLSNAGVDPNTLSADQFSIFSNQSPELQKDSLSMLVKYGAERLRIVQPGSHDSSTTPTTTPTTQAPTPQAPASAATTTKELAPQSQESVPKASRRKDKRKTDPPAMQEATAAAAANEATSAQSQNAPKSRAKVGKSRVACYRCKQKKMKCPHEKPACAACETAGETCEYPPPKPRKSKSAAIVQEGDDEDESEMQLQEEAQHVEMQQENQDHQQEEDSEPENAEEYATQSQMPVSDMLTSTLPASVPLPMAQAVPPTYFQSADGLALPRPEQPTVHYQPPPPTHTHATDADQSYNNSFTQINQVSRTQSTTQQATQAAVDTNTQKRAGRRMLVNSPRQRKQASNSPQMTTGTQQQSHHTRTITPTHVTHVPLPSYATAEQPRATSRQGQRGQVQTPQTSRAAGAHAQPTTRAQPPSYPSASQSTASNANTSATYNTQSSYVQQNIANEAQSVGRIPYEPYSQQKPTHNTDYPLHNYNRSPAMSLSMPSQQTPAVSNPRNTTSAHSNQWSSMQSRDVQAPSHDGLYGSTYNQPSTSHHTSSSSHLNTRASAQATHSDHNTRANRQQTRSSYQSQSRTQQPVAQNQTWDYFNSSTHDPYANQSNERSNYGWKYQGDWSGAS